MIHACTRRLVNQTYQSASEIHGSFCGFLSTCISRELHSPRLCSSRFTCDQTYEKARIAAKINERNIMEGANRWRKGKALEAGKGDGSSKRSRQDSAREGNSKKACQHTSQMVVTGGKASTTSATSTSSVHTEGSSQQNHDKSRSRSASNKRSKRRKRSKSRHSSERTHSSSTQSHTRQSDKTPVMSAEKFKGSQSNRSPGLGDANPDSNRNLSKIESASSANSYKRSATEPLDIGSRRMIYEAKSQQMSAPNTPEALMISSKDALTKSGVSECRSGANKGEAVQLPKSSEGTNRTSGIDPLDVKDRNKALLRNAVNNMPVPGDKTDTGKVESGEQTQKSKSLSSHSAHSVYSRQADSYRQADSAYSRQADSYRQADSAYSRQPDRSQDRSETQRHRESQDRTETRHHSDWERMRTEREALTREMLNRPVVHTVFGHNSHVNGIQGARRVQFRVVSYNVLSQNLIDENRYLYYHCQEEHLNWEFRKKNFITELHHLNADILCLQEVNCVHYEEFFKPLMDHSGYECDYKKRTGNRMDGCAIFVKKSAFTIEKLVKVEYLRRYSVLDRDNVAMVALLRHVSNRSTKLCVTNTHLLFNPKRGDVKLAQLMLLLSEVDRLAYRGTDDQGQVLYHPVVMCGDYNFQPFCDLYKFLVRGSLFYQGLVIKDMSGQGEYGRNDYLYKDFLSKGVGIADQCQYTDTVKHRLQRQKPEAESICTSSKLASCDKNVSKLDSTSFFVDGSKSNASETLPWEKDGKGSEDWDMEIKQFEEQSQKTAALNITNTSTAATRPSTDTDKHKVIINVQDLFKQQLPSVPSPVTLYQPPASRAGPLMDPAIVAIGQQVPTIQKQVPLTVSSSQGQYDPPALCPASVPANLAPTPGTKLTYGSGSVCHGLNLASAYAHGTPINREITTSHDRANCTVDFIFYTWDKSRIPGSQAFLSADIKPGEIRLVSLTKLLTDQEMRKFNKLPNAVISSDHFSLCAVFALGLTED